MSSPATFDILSAPWVPLARPDSTTAELGLIEALGSAHKFAAVRHPLLIVEFGIYRLLVAFVLDALIETNQRPKDTYHLEDLLEKGSFDLDFLRTYASNCGRVFDLFDAKRPFLQSATAGGDEKPLAALLPVVPSGTNPSHWHHQHEDAFEADPAEATRLLTTIAPFMTAGGAGLSPSINGAPAIYVLPKGRNLYETIILNLPIREIGESGTGQVAWRDDREPGGERTKARMVEALTWRPRKLRLIPPSGSKLSVSKMLFQPGDSTRLSWIDPNLAYKYGDEESRPVRMREERPLWRDAGPLALLDEGVYKGPDGKTAFRRPDAVNTAARLCKGDLTLRAYGVRTDMKMKVFEWTCSELRIPQKLGQSTRLGAWVQGRLDQADNAGRILRNSIKKLYPREGAGNKGAFDQVIARAERTYWAALEPDFPRLMDAAALMSDQALDDVARTEEAGRPWSQAIREHAVQAFEMVANDYDSDSDGLERSVRARRNLMFGLNKWLK